MDGSSVHCSDSRYLDENPLYIKPGIKLTSEPFFSKKYYIIYKKYFKSQSKSIIKMVNN